MKKVLSLCLALIIFVIFASSGYAAGMDKLKGGAERLFKSPIQLKDSIVSEYDAAKFKPFGVVGGAIKGLFNTGKEAVIGLLEIVTFPVDFPQSNKDTKAAK